MVKHNRTPRPKLQPLPSGWRCCPACGIVSRVEKFLMLTFRAWVLRGDCECTRHDPCPSVVPEGTRGAVRALTQRKVYWTCGVIGMACVHRPKWELCERVPSVMGREVTMELCERCQLAVSRRPLVLGYAEISQGESTVLLRPDTPKVRAEWERHFHLDGERIKHMRVVPNLIAG